MDPFVQVYNDTDEQLNQLLQILERKKRGKSKTSSAEISEIIAEAEDTIRDLNESIEVVRQEQALPETEIRSREESMVRIESKLKQCQSLNQETTPQRDSFDLDIEATAESETEPRNDGIQDQLLMEQDNQLDMIHQTMQNLHLQASTMGQELTEQGMLLDDMEGNFDGVMNKLSRGRRQLEWVYEHNKERLNDCCIFLLIVALVVLLVLAFIL